MMEVAEQGRRGTNPWRIALWTLAALLLLAPLVAMQFSDEVDWSVSDFAVAAVLVIGTGLALELTVRKGRGLAWRAAAATALAAVFLSLWINLAVGIIGSERNPANLMYLGVLAIALLGALLARGRPRGMARAMAVTALAQAVPALAVLTMGAATSEPVEPAQLLGLTGGFVARGGGIRGAALIYPDCPRTGCSGDEGLRVTILRDSSYPDVAGLARHWAEEDVAASNARYSFAREAIARVEVRDVPDSARRPNRARRVNRPPS